MWAPVQSPGGARDDIAKALGIKPEDMVVHTTLLGGGFGRKSKCDFAIEAALLSKEIGGAPVKVVWTREDDLRHGFYHTVTVDRFEAGLDASNKVVAWRHRSAAPTILSTFAPDPKHPFAIELGMGLVDTAVRRAEHPHGERRSAAPHAHRLVPLGQQRAACLVGPVVRRRARGATRQGPEGLPARTDRAGAGSIDPRKQVTTEWWNYGEPFETYAIDTGRLRKVAELAAERAGWGRQLPKGRGLGIAAHRSFVSYIATVVEVEVDAKGNITVPRVDTAVDCGFCVNPERVRSQIEGAAVMGLTLAKYGEITFKDGRVEQSNFNDVPIVRIDESPKETRVHIVEHTLRCAGERRRRTGRSAVRAGAVQCDLRGDRKAHPQAADRRSAGVVRARHRRSLARRIEKGQV